MKVGRPLKFNTPEDMQKRIDLYFLSCRCRQEENPELLKGLSNEDLLIIYDIDDTFPTVTGLALALDMSRRSLCDYEIKDEFIHAVKKAKQRVEAFIEQRLYHNNATGSIFNLKNNFGWKDKTESETYGKDGGAIEQKVTMEIIRNKNASTTS